MYEYTVKWHNSGEQSEVRTIRIQNTNNHNNTDQKQHIE